MSQPDETASGWNLTDEDRGALDRLCGAIVKLAALARSGQDLIAVGEACDAIEKLLSDEPIEVNVGLEIGFRRGDDNFEEGLFVCFRINDEEIRLDELNTTYSSDVGGDHFTRVYAMLSPEGNFNTYGIMEWLEQLAEVQRYDDAQLDSERDHV